MKKYIVTTTSNANCVLGEYSLEDVCGTLTEAEASASERTMDSGVNHFIFEVDLNLVVATKMTKYIEVKRIAPPK